MSLTFAEVKLKKKNADIIVANEVGSHKTFGDDNDEIWLVTHDGADHISEMPKEDLAHKVLDKTFSNLS